MRRYKNWIHKISSRDCLTIWRPILPGFPWAQGASFMLSTLNFFRRCWRSAAAAARDLILVEADGKHPSVQSLSSVRLFTTPWTTACQTALSITSSRSLFKLMSIEMVMPSNHLILSSPSPSALNLSQHQGLFKWICSSHQVAKVLELQLQHQSFQWIFRTNFL